AQNQSQLLPAFSPSSCGRGSRRGRECRTYAWRYSWLRSVSLVLTLIQAGALNQTDPSGQVRPLNKKEKKSRASHQKFVPVLCAMIIALHPLTVLSQRNKRIPYATVTVNFTPGHPANRFTPAHAL